MLDTVTGEETLDAIGAMLTRLGAHEVPRLCTRSGSWYPRTVSFATDDVDGSAQGHEAPPGLLDRLMQPRVAVAGIINLLLFACLSVPIARQPWELDARSPVVESIDSECGPATGAIYTIKVKGRSYRCPGAAMPV